MTPTPRKNSETSKSIKLGEIAALVEGELVGDPKLTITGVAGIKEARPGDITFLSNSKYLAYLDQTQASAIITPPDTVSPKKTLIRTPNPSKAFTQVISFFVPSTAVKAAGIHPTAVLGANVRMGGGVALGAYCVIEDNVVIGDGTVIDAHCFIGRETMIGAGVHIFPSVTLRESTSVGDNVIIHSGAVIGSDGFGYETVDQVHVKIPQIGSVVIEDDVEIGANVCIDRGRFQKTWIKKGTKIDNLVQIAHNVVIGENSLIISQAGISGSAELGKNVIVAGQAGIVGHIRLGDGAIVAAGAGVTKSVPDNTIVLGSPAKPIAEQKKIFALIARLPALFKDLSEIKNKLGLK